MPRQAGGTGFSQESFRAAHSLFAVAPYDGKLVDGCFAFRFPTANRLLQRYVCTFLEGKILRIRGAPGFEEDFLAPRVSRR